MNEGDQPLVTFALIAYNQEKYVREAVQGALAQDYPNLEIILSDDCSTDRTFEIMREMAGEYAGPHTVRLNRNPVNLSIGRHVNTINRLATGELIVAAAGDDISIPGRTRTLVDTWLKTGRQAGLLHSARTLIGKKGEILREHGCQCLSSLNSIEIMARDNAHVSGATEAWDKKLFNLFGEFLQETFHEDVALTFRCLLAGRPVAYADQALVQYRCQSGVTFEAYATHPEFDASKRLKELRRLRTITAQQMEDLIVVPNQLIANVLTIKAARQDAAIQFERCWPTPGEYVEFARSAGLLFTGRMIGKKVVNRWRDSKPRH